jgi:hypothetical protein
MENLSSNINLSQSKAIYDKSDGIEFTSSNKEPDIKSYDLTSSWNIPELIDKSSSNIELEKVEVE